MKGSLMQNPCIVCGTDCPAEHRKPTCLNCYAEIMGGKSLTPKKEEPKHYKSISVVGHCIILAQIVGSDPLYGDVPVFFAAYMITKDGKPGCSLAETFSVQRISNNRFSHDELIGFCQGYTQSARERRGFGPQVWVHHQTIQTENIEEIKAEERKRIRSYPHCTD